ncbi:hypothetical protein B0H11DRAFT_2316515 [Mycena galericulata]|nr:hypothetical protein B0H11DRAFT_2316515 [Mycena galericulata]
MALHENSLEPADITHQYFLSAGQKLLADLQSTLQTLTRTAEELRLECDVLEKRLKEISCYVSLLPTELLCEIFLLALPSAPSIPAGTRSDYVTHLRLIRRAPYGIADVCARWRAIALSTPGLWTAIGLHPKNFGRRELQRLSARLERSGNQPLDVTIAFGWTSNTFDEAVRVLSLHCGRWRTIHLAFKDRFTAPRRGYWRFGRVVDLHSAFLSLGPLPLLEELLLTGMTESVPSYQPLPRVDIFQHAPKLRSVVLGSHTSAYHIGLPWAQLTTYKATHSHMLTHLENVSATASNLVECDIDFGPGQSPRFIFTNHEVVALPRLCRLVVTHGSVLRYLRAPALRELHVHGMSAYTLDFLQRSACPLSQLTLFQCHAYGRQLLEILRHTPNLHSLELDLLGPPPPLQPSRFVPIAAMNARIDDNPKTVAQTLIAALTVCPCFACLCPSLTSLSWGDRNDIIDRAAFVDMVASRWRVRASNGSSSRTSPSRLRFVGVYLGRLCMKPRGRSFKIFEEEGMKVVLLNGRKGRRVVEGWREH